MAKASTSAAASGAVARRPSGATTVQRKPAGEAARGRAMARMRGGAGGAAAIARRARWAAARGRDPPARDRGPAAAPAAGAAIASRARAALPRRRPPGDAHIRPGRSGRERPPVWGGGRRGRRPHTPPHARARPGSEPARHPFLQPPRPRAASPPSWAACTPRRTRASKFRRCGRRRRRGGSAVAGSGARAASRRPAPPSFPLSSGRCHRHVGRLHRHRHHAAHRGQDPGRVRVGTGEAWAGCRPPAARRGCARARRRVCDHASVPESERELESERRVSRGVCTGAAAKRARPILFLFPSSAPRASPRCILSTVHHAAAAQRQEARPGAVCSG